MQTDPTQAAPVDSLLAQLKVSKIGNIKPGAGDAGTRFAKQLGVETQALNQAGNQRQSQMREAAQQLVASALIKPLFEQMANSPWRSERFHGGFAEDSFAKQLHTILADRMAQRSDSSLIDAIVGKLERQGQDAPPDAPAPNATSEDADHG